MTWIKCPAKKKGEKKRNVIVITLNNLKALPPSLPKH